MREPVCSEVMLRYFLSQRSRKPHSCRRHRPFPSRPRLRLGRQGRFSSFPKYQIFLKEKIYILSPLLVSSVIVTEFECIPQTTISPAVILGNHYPIRNIIVRENQSHRLHLLTKKQMGSPIFPRIENGAVEAAAA